jgi:hypothetical protein
VERFFQGRTGVEHLFRGGTGAEQLFRGGTDSPRRKEPRRNDFFGAKPGETSFSGRDRGGTGAE